MDSQNFRSLRVWQVGMEVAELVYDLSQRFPKHETYGLGSQMQRAAVSIPAIDPCILKERFQSLSLQYAK
ncbi:MAG: hypothetical protein A2V70_13555 [Planctomycetes bacterium RBG_13_63_9]|nr:MAG: hypothetical protein A2V70_13555 [Planctomycetes bacterium RBG_13_63_9]